MFLVQQIDHDWRQQRNTEQHQELPHNTLYDRQVHRALEKSHADLEQFLDGIELALIQQE